MPDLVGRVTTTLRNPGDSPWLPGLATGLADHGWKDLYHDIGLTPSDYGTARVMARDCNAPRKIVSVVPAALNDGDSAQVFQIELLGSDASRRYEESGVRFYSEEEILNRAEISKQLAEAVNTLKIIPTLLITVATLVRSIHLIDAGDGDYDVSFSEPNIPFSIFVSVPRGPSRYGAFRVAEAMIHETMHLQLTLIERIVPLTNPSGAGYFSPWRGEYRTAQGVVHALYVFRVIDTFIGKLMANTNFDSTEALEYLRSRRSEICTQMRDVRAFQECPALTNVGAIFAREILKRY